MRIGYLMKIQINLHQSRRQNCRQSDVPNPNSSRSQHCHQSNPYFSPPTNLHQFHSRDIAQHWAWLHTVQAGMIFCIVVLIAGILSAFTRLDFYLVKIPIDPDWLTVARICMGYTLTFLPLTIGFLSLIASLRGNFQVRDVSPVELTIVGLMFLILGAMALPGNCGGNQFENTYIAERVVKKIRSAQDAYFKTHGHYASRVEQLVTSPHFPDGLTELQSRIGTVGYQGYRIVSFHTMPPTGSLPATYEIQFAPTIRTGILCSGSVCYFLDQSGIIRHSEKPTELAQVNSEPISRLNE